MKMKKLVSVILTISIVITSFASVLQIYAKNEKSNSIQVGKVVIESEEDAQTPESPINISPDEYVICNKLSFIVFMKTSLLWKPSTKVILTCDIDMNGEEIKSLKEYSGRFDGCGHTISNITITKQRSFLPVLIGNLKKSAEIKNVTFINDSKKAIGLAATNFGAISNVNVKNSSVGKVGFIYGNAGIIENCSFEGKLSNSGYLGGFCGANIGKISECSFSGKVELGGVLLNLNELLCIIDMLFSIGISSINYKSESKLLCTTGGFCGYNKGEISSCETKGVNSVIANTKVYITRCGGFVGINEEKSKINNCTSVGSVTGQEFVGGFCADNRGDITESRSECRAVAKAVKHNDICGGFVGNNDKKGKIEHCMSTGSAKGQEYVGGFVGVNKSDIINCHATGKAKAKTRIHIAQAGGFVGENREGSLINNCSAKGGADAISTSCQAKSGGFVGVNKANIVNSKANGEVYVSSGAFYKDDGCGGFVGKNDKNGNIDGCYAEAIVQTTHKKKGGGFVGEAKNKSEIYNSTCKTYRMLKKNKTELAGFCYDKSKKAVIEDCDDNIQ